MLRFSLFGIPVQVQPFFWLTCLLLSGALHMQAGPAMFQHVVIWTAVVFFSILVHELGHALTGLKVGGGAAAIELNAFGGLAFNQGGRFSRGGRRWMIIMGPGAGFLLAGVTLLGMIAYYGPELGTSFAVACAANPGTHFVLPNDPRPGVSNFFQSMIFVNIWWGLINLLPIMPLDGGQLYESFSKSPRKTFLVGTVTGVVIALYGLMNGRLYLGLLMGFLAFQNYQQMQQSRY